MKCEKFKKFKKELVMWNCAVLVCLIVLLLYAGRAHADHAVCGVSAKRLAIYQERMAQHSDMIQSTLRNNNVDEQFIWLAAIESGGRPDAVSGKGAAGLWQMTAATARHYGCKDRHNVVCSTLAAAKYLYKLSVDFGGDKWKVVVGYNMGGSNYRRRGKPTNEARRLANTVTCLMENVKWE